MSEFKPIAAAASSIPSNVDNGNFIVTTDTGDSYVDIGNNRIKLTDVIAGTYNNIVGTVAPLTNKIYYATDRQKLLMARYENNSVVWSVISEDSKIINNSSAAVAIELNDNRIYYLTNANITSISLTANSNLSYCTLCFTAGTSTTFSPPTGARCIGHDCSGGIFTPVSGKEYQIAIDILNNTLTFYVLRITLE